MDRRSIFAIMAASIAAAPLLSRGTAGAERNKHHKVAIHVGTNDPAVMKVALANSRNIQEYYTSVGEEVSIEILANSEGLHMLRDDTSPVKEEIKATREKVPQLVLSACDNTKTVMETREGKAVPIIPDARLVPAVIARLVELQEQGYSYVKP
jgi:uncharacterized protein